MARPADFDLARELARPGFTPGARDAPALVELVIAGEDPAAARAATALAGLGAAGQAAIDARFDGADDGGKARLVRALGLLARAGDGDARTAVLARIADPAPRVRKAAAVALGKLGGDDARRALIARWDAGDAAPEEQRALAEALGKLGGDDAVARLKALDAHDDTELARLRDRAVLMVERTATRETPSRIRDDVAPPAPIAVQLVCRPGLGPLLMEELAALGLAARPVGDRGAELRLATPLAALFASRLWATLAIPFPLAAGDDLATAVAQTIAAPAVLGVLRAWTEGPIRWRLGFEHGHKRAVIWRAAQAVAAAVPDLINDPTATTWDVLVDDAARTLALVPRRLDDPRFAYRVADVPAASHPTVAAALAWLAEAHPGDRVWDPFCGSGIELIERARRAPLRALFGTDIDASALAAAHANLDAAGVSATLAIADARNHTPGPPGSIDLIVTNPPLGSRVQLDAAALLVAALPNFARALAPGGRLVWITPAPRRTTPVAEPARAHAPAQPCGRSRRRARPTRALGPPIEVCASWACHQEARTRPSRAPTWGPLRQSGAGTGDRVAASSTLARGHDEREPDRGGSSGLHRRWCICDGPDEREPDRGGSSGLHRHRGTCRGLDEREPYRARSGGIR